MFWEQATEQVQAGLMMPSGASGSPLRGHGSPICPGRYRQLSAQSSRPSPSLSGTSSTIPLQSLSRPSQYSGVEGFTVCSVSSQSRLFCA